MTPAAASLSLPFAEPAPVVGRVDLGPAAAVLTGFALDRAALLFAAMQAVAAVSPFRQMTTPGGWRMSVATTSCGEAGWLSDRRGYRYDRTDPETGRPWPALPILFRAIAADAASAIGFDGFVPDTCLINRYEPGARLSLHQDRNEADYGQPVVTVSLGLPAVFLWGGQRREDKVRRLSLLHGDIMVWGGPDRLAFHGVRNLADGEHPMAGRARYSLTFRKAL